MLLELLQALFEGLGQDNSLDTKKIDGHIEQLKGRPWFKEIYEDEKYHRLFFVYRK